MGGCQCRATESITTGTWGTDTQTAPSWTATLSWPGFRTRTLTWASSSTSVRSPAMSSSPMWMSGGSSCPASRSSEVGLCSSSQSRRMSSPSWWPWARCTTSRCRHSEVSQSFSDDMTMKLIRWWHWWYYTAWDNLSNLLRLHIFTYHTHPSIVYSTSLPSTISTFDYKIIIQLLQTFQDLLLKIFRFFMVVSIFSEPLTGPHCTDLFVQGLRRLTEVIWWKLENANFIWLWSWQHTFPTFYSDPAPIWQGNINARITSGTLIGHQPQNSFSHWSVASHIKF